MTDINERAAEVHAAFLIRWPATGELDTGLAYHTNAQFDGVPLIADVALATLDAPESVGDEVHPFAMQLVMQVGDSVNDKLTARVASMPSCTRPMTLVSVRLLLPDLGLIYNPESGRRGDPRMHSLLADTILDAASGALNDLGRRTPHRITGPISLGDLVGSGVIRVVMRSVPDEAFFLQLTAMPPLGSFASNAAGVSLDKLYSDPPFVLLSNRAESDRRLMVWFRRYALRSARGEWAEAVVATEAALEQFVAHVLDCILIDHGWKIQDFETRAMPNNAKSNLGALRQHLKWSNAIWKQIDADFRKIWMTRNSAIHQAANIGQRDLMEAHNAHVRIAASIRAAVTKPEVTHAHPITTWFIADREDVLNNLGSADVRVLDQLINAHSNIFDIRSLNSVIAENVAATGGPSKCWSSGEGPAFPTAFIIP